MALTTNRTRPSRGISSGGVLMRIALVLLCLVMLSVHLMGSLFARYTTAGNGADSARVAAFSVDVNGAPENLNINVLSSSESGSYVITIENDSEVAVRYTISVAVTPVNNQFDAASIAATLDTDTGILAPGPDVTGSHTLTFSVIDWTDVTENMKGENGVVSFTFVVTVDVEQID